MRTGVSSTHDNGQATQFRIAQELDRRKKSVHIEVSNASGSCHCISLGESLADGGSSMSIFVEVKRTSRSLIKMS